MQQNIKSFLVKNYGDYKGLHLHKITAQQQLAQLKQGIWIYFFLLIFEGALRKWILPGLATPLLIVRDPVAIWLMITAWRRGILQPNIYLTVVFLIGIAGTFTAILLGHGNLWVALFGARIFMVQFPMIFIVGSIFNRDDVVKIGRVMVWLTIPMALLLIAQFYSPQSAWVNRGVGGDSAGAGYSGISGYFRGPTTFSFTNGTSLFFSFAACFIMYFWVEERKYFSKAILISASVALFLAIPFSISRGLFFSILVTIGFVILAMSRKPKYLGRILLVLVSLGVLFLIVSNIGIFQNATAVFTDRFTSASETEGGVKGTLVTRYLGGLVDAFDSGGETPFFGYGLGLGTNAGAFLQTGKTDFLIAEGEWGRLIGEMGFVMGFIVILARLGVSLKLGVASYKKMVSGDIFPWIILSYVLITLPQGQWAQPTSLGFSVLSAGLTIAAMRLPATEENK